MRPIRQKHKLAADHWINTGELANSYWAAGYSTKDPDNAGKAMKRILARPEVAAYVEEREATRTEQTGITGNKIVERLWAEATVTGPFTTHSARVQALAHLARIKGLFDGRAGNGDDESPQHVTLNLNFGGELKQEKNITPGIAKALIE